MASSKLMLEKIVAIPNPANASVTKIPRRETVLINTENILSLKDSEILFISALESSMSFLKLRISLFISLKTSFCCESAALSLVPAFAALLAELFS